MILPSRTTAAGLNVAYSSHATTLSLMGERKREVAWGVMTGFGCAGFTNGPNIHDCCRGDPLATAIRMQLQANLIVRPAGESLACGTQNPRRQYQAGTATTQRERGHRRRHAAAGAAAPRAPRSPAPPQRRPR